MNTASPYEVIIIGGSYAGLSAALALGRSLRNVLVLDHAKPCNRQTPHSHNFLTHDGRTPLEISQQARQEVENYTTVKFAADTAEQAVKTDTGFEITTASGAAYGCQKLILATGLQDIMPPVLGFAECWGISVIHCPYCHGYEVRNEITGILGNGEMALELAVMVRRLTARLSIFTNGRATFSNEVRAMLEQKNIRIEEAKVTALLHTNGRLEKVALADGRSIAVKALYARPDFVQHSPLAAQLGCELTAAGHIQVNMMQETTVPGVYACGDNSSVMRSVANAVAAGNMAGAAINHSLCREEF
ncbi:MAG: NAD(P)/FAD-dependent oxidoreductase [Bacteroidetes bacterium]|nr:NAD(P)/FAD-dependent oxidoreductase [Bacteroidota bacterium]